MLKRGKKTNRTDKTRFLFVLFLVIAIGIGLVGAMLIQQQYLYTSLCSENPPDAPPAIWPDVCGYTELSVLPIGVKHDGMTYIVFVNQDGHAVLRGEDGTEYVEYAGFSQVMVVQPLPANYTPNPDEPKNILSIGVEVISTEKVEVSWYFQQYEGVWYFRHDASWQILDGSE